MFCLLRLLPQLSAHLKASFQALNLFTEVSRRERGRLWKQFSLSISFSLLRSLKTWTRFIKAPLFVYLFFSLSLSLSLFPLHVSSSSVHSSTQAAAVCSCFENHRKIERERERAKESGELREGPLSCTEKLRHWLLLQLLLVIDVRRSQNERQSW